MARKHPAWGCGCLLILLALAGCGDSGTAEVSGTVTVDGTPVEEGKIGFSPVDGKTTTAGGDIKKGLYSVQVPVGTMKVSISVPKVVGMKKLYPTPDSPSMPVTKESLPAKYNFDTQLQLEVKPGVNQKDFELQSK